MSTSFHKQAGRYFVSEEAEKAKKWDMLQEYGSVCSRLGALEDEFKQIGSAWAEMAQVFRGGLRQISLKISEEEISAFNDYTKVTICRLPSRQVNYESLCKLIRDFQDTTSRKEELERALEPTGVLSGKFGV